MPREMCLKLCGQRPREAQQGLRQNKSLSLTKAKQNCTKITSKCIQLDLACQRMYNLFLLACVGSGLSLKPHVAPSSKDMLGSCGGGGGGMGCRQ